MNEDFPLKMDTFVDLMIYLTMLKVRKLYKIFNVLKIQKRIVSAETIREKIRLALLVYKKNLELKEHNKY